tara:strand:+ start:360 stop:533 length:174 start_codon:yes stop_codon:yes gene_type:complete
MSNAVEIQLKKKGESKFETDSYYIDYLPGGKKRVAEYIKSQKEDSNNDKVKVIKLND